MVLDQCTWWISHTNKLVRDGNANMQHTANSFHQHSSQKETNKPWRTSVCGNLEKKQTQNCLYSKPVKELTWEFQVTYNQKRQTADNDNMLQNKKSRNESTWAPDCCLWPVWANWASNSRKIWEKHFTSTRIPPTLLCLAASLLLRQLNDWTVKCP